MAGKGRPRLDTAQLSIRLEIATLVRLEGICLELGISKAHFIERLIKNYKSESDHTH